MLSGVEEAINWGKILFSKEFVDIIYSNETIISSAWSIFQNEVGERKPMNFTDCVVLATSKPLKCEEIYI